MGSDRPLRILHVAAPGQAGGLESVVLDLTVGLRSRGHRIKLATVLDEGSESPHVADRAEAEGVEVERIAVPRRGYLTEYHALRGVVRSWRPDVVHTHGYRADLLAGAAARYEGGPWVTTVHGFTGGGGKNRFYEWLQVQSYRRAQGVIAVSQPLQERLSGAGVPRARLHVVPNAWSAKPLLPRAEARQRLGIETAGPVIGWVGRLSREKGADLLLEALALLPRTSWRASVIGSGREREALGVQAQRLGVADRIVWHGHVPEASALYRAFDVWVLSSRTEGTPIALFEAMAAEVPVVATRVGGVPDVVSDLEAALVPPSDPRALAAAMRAVLEGSSAASTRAAAARTRLEDGYPLERWLEAHEKIYRGMRIV